MITATLTHHEVTYQQRTTGTAYDRPLPIAVELAPLDWSGPGQPWRVRVRLAWHPVVGYPVVGTHRSRRAPGRTRPAGH